MKRERLPRLVLLTEEIEHHADEISTLDHALLIASLRASCVLCREVSRALEYFHSKQ